MDEGDAYSKADREEHARRKAEMEAAHQARVKSIQEHIGLSWDAKGTPLPKNTNRPKRPAEPSRTVGKKRWIYFEDSGRWIEATEMGFDQAIEQGRPVRRSNSKPRLPPGEILREPNHLYPPDPPPPTF